MPDSLRRAIPGIVAKRGSNGSGVRDEAEGGSFPSFCGIRDRGTLSTISIRSEGWTIVPALGSADVIRGPRLGFTHPNLATNAHGEIVELI